MTVPQLTFTEAAPLGPHPAGDVGGDYQVSEAWSRRWTAPWGDGTYAVIDVSFYIEDDTNSESLNPMAKLGPMLTRMTDYHLCTDLDDPGGSEVAAWNEYDSIRMPDGLPPEDQADYVLRLFCAAVDRDEIVWKAI